jgi:hypothetical protein
MAAVRWHKGEHGEEYGIAFAMLLHADHLHLAPSKRALCCSGWSPALHTCHPAAVNPAASTQFTCRTHSLASCCLSCPIGELQSLPVRLAAAHNEKKAYCHPWPTLLTPLAAHLLWNLRHPFAAWAAFSQCLFPHVVQLTVCAQLCQVIREGLYEKGYKAPVECSRALQATQRRHAQSVLLRA